MNCLEYEYILHIKRTTSTQLYCLSFIKPAVVNNKSINQQISSFAASSASCNQVVISINKTEFKICTRNSWHYIRSCDEWKHRFFTKKVPASQRKRKNCTSMRNKKKLLRRILTGISFRQHLKEAKQITAGEPGKQIFWAKDFVLVIGMECGITQSIQIACVYLCKQTNRSELQTNVVGLLRSA